MGLLDNFEHALERVVNGAFAKTFKSGLAPIEITSALRRELDTRAVIVSRDRILVPNRFAVRLGRTDFQAMSAVGPSLIDELMRLVETHAVAQGYHFAGGLSIGLQEDPTLPEGMIRVDSENVRGAVRWTPVLDVAGRRHPLQRGRTVIGRGSDADITVDDAGISRRHIEVAWDGRRAQVTDLGSTNGSLLDGAPVQTALLSPDSVVTIGATRIVFRVLAQSDDDVPADRERGTPR